MGVGGHVLDSPLSLPCGKLAPDPCCDHCRPYPCRTGVPVCPQKQSTVLSPHERGTMQCSTGHFLRKKRLHSGILLIAAEKTYRRRKHHRSFQNDLTNIAPGAKDNHAPTIRNPAQASGAWHSWTSSRRRMLGLPLTAIPCHALMTSLAMGQVLISSSQGSTFS
jgi:hypothetical protein